MPRGRIGRVGTAEWRPHRGSADSRGQQGARPPRGQRQRIPGTAPPCGNGLTGHGDGAGGSDEVPWARRVGSSPSAPAPPASGRSPVLAEQPDVDVVLVLLGREGPSTQVLNRPSSAPPTSDTRPAAPSPISRTRDQRHPVTLGTGGGDLRLDRLLGGGHLSPSTTARASAGPGRSSGWRAPGDFTMVPVTGSTLRCAGRRSSGSS